MKYLIAAFALLTLSACSSVGKVAYPISELNASGERRAPTLEHNDTRHDWDDIKSFALNVAQLDGGHTSLQDADLPEDAQREVSGGYRLGHFLVNAWAGTFTQAVFFDSMPRNHRDAYRFEPYAIVFVDADTYNSELKGSEDGGFSYVFNQIKSQFESALVNEYDDETLQVLMWNKAAGDLWLPVHNRSWRPETDFVITSLGGACEASTEARALGMRDFDTEQTYASWTLGGLAAPENCNIFGEVEPIGYVDLAGEQKYAFKVVLTNNYFVPTLATNTDISWVVSTYWKDGHRYQETQFPFVSYEGKAWMFIHTNDSVEL